MNDSAIASTILSRTGRLGSGLAATPLKHLLGENGYRTALEKRWLVPDQATGELALNPNPDVQRVIREAAAQNAPAPAAVRPQTLPSVFSTSRSTPPSLNEMDPDDGVGTGVVIADAGKSYPATVKARYGDGTYQLSFGDQKPANPDRRYRKEELNFTAKPGTAPNSRPAPSGQPTPPPAPRAGSPAPAPATA